VLSGGLRRPRGSRFFAHSGPPLALPPPCFVCFASTYQCTQFTSRTSNAGRWREKMKGIQRIKRRHSNTKHHSVCKYLDRAQWVGGALEVFVLCSPIGGGIARFVIYLHYLIIRTRINRGFSLQLACPPSVEDSRSFKADCPVLR